MPEKQSNGVVIVRRGAGQVIHRPETGGNHGKWVLDSGDWILYPNFDVARNDGYLPCGSCFSVAPA